MSSAAINPLGSGDAGLGTLAERWQQVAAAVARPAEGAGQPGEATATAGSADGAPGAPLALDAANRLPPTSPGVTTGAAPRTSMFDSLPPAQASAAMSAAAMPPGAAPAALAAAGPGAPAQAVHAAALPAAANPATRLASAPAAAADGAPQATQATLLAASGAAAAALAQPPASTGTTPRPTADTLQVPVAVSPLFTTSMAPLRRPPLPQAQRRPVQRVQPRGEEHGHDAPPDDDPEDTNAADHAALAATGAPAQKADAPVPGTAPAQPDLLAWRAMLQQGGHQALLRELDLRRHILLVCPQPALPGDLRDRAVAWLLGGPQHTALALPARFLVPAGLGLPAQWRLHRTEGGPQDGLRSRPTAAGMPPVAPTEGRPPGQGATPAIGCRITFGDLPLLPDPLHAHLSLAQPRRFLRALAGQWSLLLLVWPDGAAA